MVLAGLKFNQLEKEENGNIFNQLLIIKEYHLEKNLTKK